MGEVGDGGGGEGVAFISADPLREAKPPKEVTKPPLSGLEVEAQHGTALGSDRPLEIHGDLQAISPERGVKDQPRPYLIRTVTKRLRPPRPWSRGW